jgi:TonB family protein
MIRLVILSMMSIFSLSLMAQEEIPIIVEEMPTFLDCENDSISTKRCTERKLLAYINTNIKYPKDALNNGTKGLVVVTFVVNKEGKIEAAKTLKDIGDGCGDEVIRVINTMNEGRIKWTAGKQKGEKVKVRYNVPVRFKLPKEFQTVETKTLSKTLSPKVNDRIAILGVDCLFQVDSIYQRECTDDNLLEYIWQNINLFKLDETKAYGAAVVSFVINTKGMIEDIKITKSANKILDNEVIRVFQSMNNAGLRWRPAVKDGMFINTRYSFPYSIKIIEEGVFKKVCQEKK